MPIYRLTPRNLQHQNWTISRYTDEVVIRAPSEEDARWAATAAFKIPTAFIPGAPYYENPWRQDALVQVTEMDDAEIEAAGWGKEGQLLILKPTGYNELL